MQPRALQAVFFVVTIVLVAGLLAGCGGGGQAEGDSQDNGSGGAEQQQNGGGNGSDQQNEGTERERTDRRVKIALGTIASVTPNVDELTLQPSAEEQGEEPIPFEVRPTTRVMIGGQEAELVAVQEGQQAKVRYVTVDGTNRARAVQVVGE
jgi:hypothetical protein